MKLENLLMLFFILFNLISLGQDKVIRIGPPCPLPKPEPVIIFDGIRIPSNMTQDILNEKSKEIIDSVSVQIDSIFNCDGILTNLGIAKIYSKDSVNMGAKKILALTNNCLCKYPLTRLIINKEIVEWNEKTYYKLIGLKPEDIVYAKVMLGKKGNCDMILKLKIKE